MRKIYFGKFKGSAVSIHKNFPIQNICYCMKKRTTRMQGSLRGIREVKSGRVDYKLWIIYYYIYSFIEYLPWADQHASHLITRNGMKRRYPLPIHKLLKISTYILYPQHLTKSLVEGWNSLFSEKEIYNKSRSHFWELYELQRPSFYSKQYKEGESYQVHLVDETNFPICWIIATIPISIRVNS